MLISNDVGFAGAYGAALGSVAAVFAVWRTIRSGNQAAVVRLFEERLAKDTDRLLDAIGVAALACRDLAATLDGRRVGNREAGAAVAYLLVANGQVIATAVRAKEPLLAEIVRLQGETTVSLSTDLSGRRFPRYIAGDEQVAVGVEIACYMGVLATWQMQPQRFSSKVLDDAARVLGEIRKATGAAPA